MPWRRGLVESSTPAELCTCGSSDLIPSGYNVADFDEKTVVS
jgi:hypothetical protein